MSESKREQLARLKQEVKLKENSINNNDKVIDMFLPPIKTEELKSIPLNKLKPFKNHIFHLYEGERLDEMVNSIKSDGVMVPIIVRPIDDYFEILAGHNRENASKIAGLTEVPCVIKHDLTDEQAELITITTNLNQRAVETMLPSELAWALRRQNEILKHQGKRNDLTSVPMEQKSLREKIGQEFKLSQSNVQRYIRLTYLNTELLQFVDDKKISFRSSVEISYLKSQEMSDLYEYISNNKINISIKIAEELKKLSQASEDNIDIKSILDELNKPEEKISKSVKLTSKELNSIIPKEDIVNSKEIIIKALKLFYGVA